MRIPTYIPTLSRRLFLKRGLASVSGFYLLPTLRPSNVQAQERVKLRGGAENCIFLFLTGGASQLDTFDIKEGRWTPPEFDIRTIKPGIVLPFGLFPKLSERIDQLAIMRSVAAWESSHPRAQYYLQAGHPPSPARQRDIPSIGAVVAYEFDSRRTPTDFLPPFVAMNFADDNQSPFVREGCLPTGCGPVPVDTRQDMPLVVAESERAIFERRWRLLEQIEGSPEGGLEGAKSSKPYKQFVAFDDRAFHLMSSPRLPLILSLNEDARKRYGDSALGDACILARNLILAEAGTHYVSISHSGWDLHANIYDKTARVNHFTLCRELDTAFSALLADLGKARSKDGKTILEKTFIACTGEFGRTGGDLTVNKGRDHNRMAQTALFAGGGVKGGRVFGVTDEQGVKVTKPEWSQKRPVYTEDIVATIYSGLSIDWSKKITNTPSGRAFEYLEPMSSTDFIAISEISELFG